MAKPSSNLDKEIKRLETLLAKEIQVVADLLKENKALETELENLKCRCETWRKYYEKLNTGNKIHCNREEAMAVFARASSPGSYE